MQTVLNTEITIADSETIKWPQAVALPAARVLQGSPAASTHVLGEADGYQVGMWRVSPGAFVTDHSGYVEFFHVLAGVGQLIDDQGVVTDLKPGATVHMPDGWIGRWVITEAITKSFSIVRF